MKAEIIIALSDKDGKSVTERMAVEAPSLEVLRDIITRTAVLQMPELLETIFKDPFPAQAPGPNDSDTAGG